MWPTNLPCSQRLGNRFESGCFAPPSCSPPENLENIKVIIQKTTANFTLILGCLSFCAAQASADPWLGDYAEAYRISQIDGKPLLMLFEKPFERSSQFQQVSDLSQPVRSSLLSPYTLCRIDVTSESGREIAGLFGVTRFPYIAITDKHLKRVIFRRAGNISDLDWATMLISYREGTQPKVDVSTFRSTPTVCYT